MLKLVITKTSEEVTAITILGDQTKRFALTAPADEYGRMRLLHRPR